MFSLLRRNRKQQCRLAVLVFHRVIDGTPLPFGPEKTCSLPSDNFARILEHLSHTFHVFNAADLRSALEGHQPRFPEGVLLTFDDGFADNAELAAPLLIKNGIEALLFAATGYIDGTAEPYEYVLARHLATHGDGPVVVDGIEYARARDAYDAVRSALKKMPRAERDETWRRLRQEFPAMESPHLLTWSQLRDFQEKGPFAVESHGVHHAVLAGEERGELAVQLRDSRQRISEQTGRLPTLISYPYGAANSSVHRAARRAGYRAGFTTEPVVNNLATCNPFALGRFAGESERLLEARSLDDIASLLAPSAQKGVRCQPS
ncbi:MAG: hypothetical protein PWP23_2922 [Candidatus Sumerlaeota bacterium]|nr:hypothetical protein [Candidatus Sumerlaeota bacterium]